MADIDLPYGPWTQILSAQWGEYPMSVYQNPDKVILMIIFEKSDAGIGGVLVITKKAFTVEGDVTKFILAQKKEMVFVEKFSKDARHAYLLVGPAPDYVNYSQEDLLAAVKKQYAELDATTKLTKEVVSGYGAKATDLSRSSEEDVQVLLGDPFTLFALARPERSPESIVPFAKIRLGVDSKGNVAEAKLSSLSSAVVVGGKKAERLHALHVLAEEALQNNVPCLIIDSSEGLLGLKEPNKDTATLEKFGVKPVPVGYPCKVNDLGTTMFIDLAEVSSDSFLSAFGLTSSEPGALIRKALDAKKVSGLGDLAAEISAQKESKEIPQYMINKAVRVVRVIQKMHPSLFAKNLNEDWLMPWQEGVGKVFYISVGRQPQNVQHFFIHSLLKSMPLPEGKLLRLLIVFEQDISDIAEDVSFLLDKFRRNGVGFAVQAEHEVDLELVQEPALKIELLDGEAAATEVGERPKRFTLRPGLTLCSEKKA